MCLLVILFLCAAIIGRFEVLNNSRFGAINSRLGRFEFPVSLLREFAGNILIWRMIFADKWRFHGENRRNSRFHGNNRESIETTDPVGG
jgi:hypothetical protein